MKEVKARIFSLYQLIDLERSQEVEELRLNLSSLRPIPQDLISDLHPIFNSTNFSELKIRILQLSVKSAINFLELQAREDEDPNKKESGLEAAKNIIHKLFSRFKSFTHLWKSLLLPKETDPDLTMQARIIFLGLLYFFQLDLANLNWNPVLQSKTKLEKKLAGKTKHHGFLLFQECFQILWEGLLSHHLPKDDVRAARILYSVLDFFIIQDLTGKPNHQEEQFFGACHLRSKTFYEDAFALLSLVSGTSKSPQIWRALSSFTPLHLLLALYRVAPSKAQLEKQIDRLLSPMKKAVNSFIPPQFSPNPQPAKGIIYTIFEALLCEVKKEQDLHKLALGYLDLEKMDGHGCLKALKTFAFEVTLLQETAIKISKSDTYLEDMKKWRGTRHLSVFHKIITHSETRQFFFLCNVKPLDKMNEMLRNHEACESLNIKEEFRIPKELQSARYYLFPFVVNQGIPEGKEYQELEDLITQNNENAAAQWITDLCKKDETAYLRARLYLATIAYFQFYNLSKRCDLILKLLQEEGRELLKITEDDMRAYNIFCGGGIKGEENDDLSWFFTNEGRKTHDDLTLRHLMANILIFVLGSPPKSNHLYTRIFAPENLSDHIRGPGSTFPNEQDCGYYLDERGNPEIRLERYSNIFGGSRLYLLGFNLITWASLCLSLLVGPVQDKTDKVGKVCFHGGYREFDKTLKTKVHLTDSQALKYYVLQRPNMFYHWLKQHPNLLEKNIEAPFFISQVLYAIWKDILATHGKEEGEVYKGVYNHEGETRKYEDRIKEKAFDYVMSEYQKLRDPYESFLMINQGIKKVIAHRDLLSYALQASVYPLPVQDCEQKAISEESPDSQINKFRNAQRFIVIKHLPFLVYFYNWIHKNLAFRLKRDSEPTLTLLEAFKVLPHKKSREGKNLFAQFKKVWNEILENHQGYQVCRVAQEAGEAHIPPCDNDFYLLYLVDLGFEVQEGNHLFRVIEDVCKVQNEIAPDSAIVWPVETLREGPEARSVLLQVEDSNSLAWVAHFARLNKKEVVFDWEGINAQVDSYTFFSFFFFFFFLSNFFYF